MKFRVMNRDSDKKIVESFTCSNGKKLNSKTVDIIVDSINDDISTLKTNFQLGCSKIAGAITAQGVNTASDASIDTIIANARQIVGPSTDTTINGQTATSDLNLQTIYAGNSSVDATTLSSILGVSVTGTSKVYITV